MKKTEYRLDEQIRQAFLSLETKWAEKEIGFQVDMEEVKYTGTEGLFMHIWTNLLDNAIRDNYDVSETGTGFCQVHSGI